MTASEAIRSTVADIDLDAIASNVEAIRARSKADVIAVVKADAYGHGAEAVAETCFEAGGAVGARATGRGGGPPRGRRGNRPPPRLFRPHESPPGAHPHAPDH